MLPGGNDEPEFPGDAVEVGTIVGAWGVKGGIKVRPLSSDPQALFSSKRWFLRPPSQPPAGLARVKVWPRVLRIATAREQGDHVVAIVQDLADRDAAAALSGGRVFVSRASFPTPGPDEFYWVDLIGLAVHNREGLVLGTVVGLIETGPSCVLRVEPPMADPKADEEPAEMLIPFVSAYVDEVDLAGRKLTVDWHPDY